MKSVGMTTGAFYGYYKSKEELFEALVGEHYAYPRNLILQTRTSDCNSAKKNTMLEMLMNLQVFSAIVLLSVSFLVVSFVCSNKVCYNALIN